MRGIVQRLDDRQKDTVYVFQHLIIPETQNAVSLPFQPFASFPVFFTSSRFGMLAAVKFDDEFLVEAREVGDEGPARYLALELVALELTVTQSGPETLFRCCLIASEAAGSFR